MSVRGTGTCPDCGRAGLKLIRRELFPNHKPSKQISTWPNPAAVKKNGYCKGGGRWIDDMTHKSAMNIH